MTDVRNAADTALRRSPAQWIFERRAARGLAVLAYHGVESPEQLGRQLDLLVRAATPVSLPQVTAALAGGMPLPPRAVLVTFDDGHASLLHEGLPVLRERAVPAVAFVLPGVHGTRRPFWWVEAEALHAAGARVLGGPRTPAELVAWLKRVPDQRRLEVLAELREKAPQVEVATEQLDRDGLTRLRDGGVEIGNHTWSHPCLDRCSDEEVRRQVRLSHEWLSDALGEPPTSFAYPNGNHDPRTERLLEELGYRTGFLFDHRLARPDGGRHPLRLSRLRVATTTSLDRFAIILSGLHPALHHARGRA